MGPLNGYTVIELAGLGPGPMGGMMLADMGAELIRIDRAGGMDPRLTEKVSGRGKKSVVLNLKDPRGVETLLRMVENADVIIQQVGGYDFIVVIGGVREGTVSIAVSQGPDPWNTGSELVIDLDVASFVHFETSLLETEIIRVGLPPGRQQQVRSFHPVVFILTVQTNNNPIRALLNGNALGVQTHVYFLVLEDFPDGLRHIFVVAANQARPHLHDRDPAAKALVHLAELEANIAPSDDDQMLGQKVNLHHARVGQELWLSLGWYAQQ